MPPPLNRRYTFSHAFTRLAPLAAGGIGTIGATDHLGGLSRVEVFDRQKGEWKHEIEDDKLKGLVEQIEFDLSENGCHGGDHSGFVTFYDLESGNMIHQEKAPMHVHEFAVNEDHTEIFAVGHGRIAHFEFKSDRPAPPAAPPLPETA